MPFPEQTAKAFTQEGIEWLNPNQYGCYGIFRSGAWIYVGKGDIRTRLLAHLNGDNPCITRQKPTSYVAVVTANMDREEKNLISELTPICNQKVG